MFGNATAVATDTIIVQHSEAMAATVEGRIVLLSVRAGAYFELNRVGGEIWEMLSAPRRVGDICEILAQSHDADLAEVTRDVIDFVAVLIKRKLARVVGPDEMR